MHHFLVSFYLNLEKENKEHKEILDKIMEQNRNRQKTYYNNRKQEILAKKVARKEQDKVFKTPLPPDPMKPHKFTVDMIIV